MTDKHFDKRITSGEGADSLVRVGEDRFERLIAEVEDYAIFFLEPDGTIASWNKGAEKIKGYTGNEILGKNFRLFYPAEDKGSGLPERLLAIAAEKGKATHEGWRIRKNGSRFWGSITITAIHDESRCISGYLKVTRDLTEKRIADDNLNNYVEELRLKNEELRKSEERYHKMIAEVRDYAIILMDRDGKILDWNKGAEHVKGYTATEIVGKTFRLFYTQEDRDRGLPEQLLNEAMANGSVIHEGWRVRKDGRRFWGYVSITALHKETGEVFGFSKVTRDLTEKKLADERTANILEELKRKNELLRQSEERYHRMIEEVQDYAIIFLNLRGEIQNWNVGAENINGYVKDEVIGRHFRLFYTPEDREQGLPERLLAEALRNGRAECESLHVRKDNTWFWVHVVLTALHGSDNRIIGFSKVTRDLTERKLAEEALARKNKALEQANVELSSFAFIASHDLKEPLRKIQIYSSRLAGGAENEQKKGDALQKIVDSARRMQILIDDLLSFSKLATNEVKTDVDLNDVIRQVKTDLEIAIQEKQGSIKTGPLPIVHGIGFQLHQLFLNLFSNALKFSRTGVPPTIEVISEAVSGPVVSHGIQETRDWFRITVRDNGIGFHSAHAKKIFEIFYRLHSKESFEGTGIGLAIVKKVLDNHGGLVAAEGTPGEGATFFLYFPKP